MLLDAQCLFSDAQAITATAASTNVVRFGKGEFTFVPLLIQVVEDFATLTIPSAKYLSYCALLSPNLSL